MSAARENRSIDPYYYEDYVLAVGSVIGDFTLHMLLGNTGDAYNAAEMTPEEIRRYATASEFARIQEVIRSYYGAGARGTLTRIGYELWRRTLERATSFERLSLWTGRLLSLSQRRMRTLEFVSERIGGPDRAVSVHPYGREDIVVDRLSYSTYRQHTKENICWVTVGILQAALSWGTGSEHDVEEIECMAAGAENCKFRIRA
jgi:predicted hydrocarbon binding protein